MKTADCKRVIDFFFHVPEVSWDLCEDFGRWLSLYGSDPEVDAVLFDKWMSHSPQESVEENLMGFSRLVDSILMSLSIPASGRPPFS